MPTPALAALQRGPGAAQDKPWQARANKTSARPSAAHQARSCGSLSTSYAAWINLNCSAASSAFSRFLSAGQFNETVSAVVRPGGSSRPAAPGTEPGGSAVPPRRTGPGPGPGPGPGRTRVPAQRQPAVRPLQLLLGGVAPHAQHLVVALHGDGGGGRRGGDTGTAGTAASRREGRGRQREERGGRGGTCGAVSAGCRRHVGSASTTGHPINRIPCAGIHRINEGGKDLRDHRVLAVTQHHRVNQTAALSATPGFS